jgi:acid phosphatase type 7
MATAALALLVLALPASLAVTSTYVRPPPRATLSLLQDAGSDGQTPQQVRRVAVWIILKIPAIA